MMWMGELRKMVGTVEKMTQEQKVLRMPETGKQLCHGLTLQGELCTDHILADVASTDDVMEERLQSITNLRKMNEVSSRQAVIESVQCRHLQKGFRKYRGHFSLYRHKY